MLENLFTRLGSQFREGGIIHAKFVTSAGPVFAAKSTRAGSSHRKLTLEKNGGTGLLKLTLAGGAREIAIIDARYVNVADPTDITDCMSVNLLTLTESTGVLTFVVAQGDGAAEAATDPFATDELHFTLYVAK